MHPHKTKWRTEMLGARVSVLTRSEHRAAFAREQGLDVQALQHLQPPLPSDKNNISSISTLINVHADARHLPPPISQQLAVHFLAERTDSATHLLSTVPPTEDGDPILNAYATTLQTAKNLQWLGFLSSTSVYGRHDGHWVTESTQPNEPGNKGRAFLHAEEQWNSFIHDWIRQHAQPLRSNIIRLGGLYGLDRSAIHSLLRRPRTYTNDHMLTSRIHVDDVVQGLVAAISSSTAHRIYNFVDDLPATPRQVFDYAEHLIEHGSAGPVACARLRALRTGQHATTRMKLCMSDEKLTQTSLRRATERTSKRVSNARFKQDLLPILRFPTYIQGLDAIADAFALQSNDSNLMYGDI